MRKNEKATRQREIYELHKRGKKPPEIADFLKVSVGYVRVCIWKERKRMDREDMTETLYGDHNGVVLQGLKQQAQIMIELGTKILRGLEQLQYARR